MKKSTNIFNVADCLCSLKIGICEDCGQPSSSDVCIYILAVYQVVVISVHYTHVVYQAVVMPVHLYASEAQTT